MGGAVGGTGFSGQHQPLRLVCGLWQLAATTAPPTCLLRARLHCAFHFLLSKRAELLPLPLWVWLVTLLLLHFPSPTLWSG